MRRIRNLNKTQQTMKKGVTNHGFRVILSLFALATAPVVMAQHADDPGPIQHEHGAVFGLVPHSEATHHAMRSGRWGDPGVWMNGEVPTDGARVVIAGGVEILLDHVNRTFHKTIRVDGQLTFATDVDTGLRVDTMVVAHSGTLQMGTVDDPVQAGVTAKIIIADDGPIDIAWDPNELSRGLICHGRAVMHGQAKTPHARLSKPAKRRQKDLDLEGEPVNWSVGDLLVLPGNHSRRDFDETLVITRIQNNRVTVAGLDDHGNIDSGWRGLNHRHQLPNGMLPFVINISRNVVIESENVFHADEYGVNRSRGHVMFMHSGAGRTDTRWVGAYGLGRTDKRTPLESPEFDEHGHRIADRGINAVGRYAWHFHRGGPAGPAAIVQGLAIVDSPGLGLVNHSSHVECSDSVAYNVVGSAFFTEAGNETGFFDNCAAVRMPGSGEGVEARRRPAGVVQEVDFGHSGHGFWLQGGGVRVKDALVAGSGDAAIIFFTVPLDEEGIGSARFDGSLLAPEIALGRETIPVGSVPLHLDGAYVFACRRGIETKFHQLNARHGVRSLIENATTIWAGTALTIPYTRNLTVADSAFVGNSSRRASGRAMRRNSVTKSIDFVDLDLRYWFYGLDMPLRGHNRVIDGVYQNVRDINISTTRDDERLIEILGDVQFPDLTVAQRTHGRGSRAWTHDRHQVYLRTNFRPKFNDITRLFARDIIRLGTIKYQDMQLFYYAQAADYVPFPAETAAAYVPRELIDLSNAQMWERYGLAIGDAVAPADAFVDSLIHGLVGNPIEYAPKVRIRSRRYSNNLTDYRLVYDVYGDDGSRQRFRGDRGPIREGWNLFTFTADDQLRTLLVFGDITPPGFVLSDKVPGVINPLDLRRGFRIVGTITDNSFGEKMFRKLFRGSHLTRLPVLTRDDGSQYVELKFFVQDFARNRTWVLFELGLDPNEPLDHVKKRKRNSARPVKKALLYLLGFDSAT